MECQLDFGRLGMMLDPVTGRRRAVHALIFTAVCSRHVFVWLCFTQTLADVIAGSEAAWRLLRGRVQGADPGQPQTRCRERGPDQPDVHGRLVGLRPGPRVRHRPGAGAVAEGQAAGGAGRAVRARQLLRRRVVRSIWPTRSAASRCGARSTAGLRVHGTTAQRPAEHFAAEEQSLLLPPPRRRYDVPVFATPKVAPDRHVEIGRALYSVPGELIGQRVQARVDSRLVKIYARGQLIKTHPRRPPGGRSTDPADYPVGRAEYALRDVETLKKKAAAAGFVRRCVCDPAAGRAAAVDQHARRLSVARADPQLRRGRRGRRLRPRAGTRRRRRAQDRPHARAGPRATTRTRTAAKVVGGAARFARENTEYRAGRE